MSDDWNDQGDYSTWGWKAVVKAVTGRDPDHPENNVNAKSLVDPQTVQDTADTFWYAEQVIQQSAQAIKEQSDALAGENGPWKGAAARALHGVMGTLAQQVQKLGDTLSGGATGDYDIPQQLANNAAHLREAGNKIMDIDHFYAQQALAQDPGLMMDNGSVHIGAKPKLVAMMSSDMAQVMNVLGSHYKITEDNVVQPTSPHNPAAGGAMHANFGSGVPNPYNRYGGYSPNLPGNGSGAPSYTSPGTRVYHPIGPRGAGDHAPDPYRSGDTEAMPDLRTDGGPGAGKVPDYTSSPDLSTGAPDIGSLTAYPDTGLSGTDAPNGSASPASYGDTSLGGGDGQVSPYSAKSPLLPDSGDISPTSYPDTGLSGLGGLGGSTMPGSGAADPAMDAALNPAMTMPKVGTPPGLGLGGTSTRNAPQSSKGNFTPKPYTGDLGLRDAGNLGGGTGTGPGTGGATPHSPASLPHLNTSGINAPDFSGVSRYPDTGLSAGSPGGVSAASYPHTGLSAGSPGGKPISSYPDTGLSAGSPDGKPVSSYPHTGLSAGSPGGVSAASYPHTGLSAGSPGGMPVSSYPDTGLSAGSPGGTTGSSSPDTGLGSAGPGAASMPLGASGGTSGTNVPGHAGGPGMPMMPMGGMGAGGAGGAGSGGGPSDASGLLRGDAAPWRGSTQPDDIGQMGGGTASGGEGLDFSPRGLPEDGLTLDGFGDGLSPSGLSSEGLSPDGLPADGLSLDSAGSHSDSGLSSSAPNGPEAARQRGVGMPMMPMGGMGGMGAGAAGRDAGSEPSDASGLLHGSTEGWLDAAAQGDAPVGSPTGAPQGGAGLSLDGTDLVGQPAQADGADASAEPATAAPGTSAQAAADTGAFGDGVLNGLPFLASAWGAAMVGQAAQAAGSWGAAGQPAAPTSRTGVATGAHAATTGPAATPSGVPQADQSTAPAPQAAPGVPATAAASAPQAAPNQAASSTQSPPTPAQTQTSREAPEAVHQPEPSPTVAPVQQASAAPAQTPAVSPATSPSAQRAAAQSASVPSRAPAAGTEPAAASAASAPAPAPAPASASASMPSLSSVSAPASASVPATAPAAVPAPAPVSPFASAPAARASTASTSTQGHPTADTADSRSTPSAASQTAGEAGEAGESDEAEAWDASLLPLLGGKGSRSDGASDADAGLLREEQVGAAGVVGASAYMTARGAGADQAFAEPTRPAWRPKPAAEGALPRPEFACSGAEPEKRSAADPADTDAEKDDTARGRGKGRSKKRDEEGGSSVADLLRQSEDIWG